MSERRMFAKTIIDSDAFIEMPETARLLYYDLAMRADDDGFINSPKKIQRMIGARDEDLQLLIKKKFLIAFESGVVVIKHWKIHNYIPKDRYKPTVYKDEMAQLEVKENNAYSLYTDCIQNVYKLDTQVRLGKDRLGKDNNNIPPQPPKLEKEHINGAEFVTMTNDEYEKLIATYGKEFTDKCVEVLDNYKGSSGRKYKSDYRAILSWVANKVNETKQKEKKTNAYVNETQSEYNDLDRFYN
jgi:hypothetical protein